MFYLLNFTLILPLLKLMLIRQNCLINIFILFLLAVTSQCPTQWICLFLTTHLIQYPSPYKRYLMLLLILIHTKQVELITFWPQFYRIVLMCLHSLFITFLWLVSIVEPYLVNGKPTKLLLCTSQVTRPHRPISLLCIISKVLKRLTYDKIIDLVASSYS